MNDGNIYFNLNSSNINTFKSSMTSWNTDGNPLTVEYIGNNSVIHTLNKDCSEKLDNLICQKKDLSLYFSNKTNPVLKAEDLADLLESVKILQKQLLN